MRPGSLVAPHVRAVLFDLDGVLVDATEWHYHALNRALAHHAFTISRADHETVLNGLPTQRKLEWLSTHRGLSRSLHADIQHHKQLYTQHEISLRCTPNHEIIALLTALRSEHVRLAVCTNSIRATLDTMLRASDLETFFELTLSNEDVARCKPAPDVYLKAMELLGVSPEETIIVEDSPHGLAAARASRATVWAVSGVRDVCLAMFAQAHSPTRTTTEANAC